MSVEHFDNSSVGCGLPSVPNETLQMISVFGHRSLKKGWYCHCIWTSLIRPELACGSTETFDTKAVRHDPPAQIM